MDNYIDKEVSDALAKEITEKIVGQLRTRVKKGETFWRISFYPSGVDIDRVVDVYDSYDNQSFESGNYFHTKEDAESMARKLRAVLKGAEVIEMPSENEADDIVWNQAHKGGYAHDSHYPMFRDGWETCYDWLKSKIVK